MNIGYLEVWLNLRESEMVKNYFIIVTIVNIVEIRYLNDGRLLIVSFDMLLDMFLGF